MTLEQLQQAKSLIDQAEAELTAMPVYVFHGQEDVQAILNAGLDIEGLAMLIQRGKVRFNPSVPAGQVMVTQLEG